MSLSLFALRLSDKQKLMEQLRKGDSTELATALSRFLRRKVTEGGADEAYVYATAVELTSIGVWELFDNQSLLGAMKTSAVETRRAFFRGIPQEIAEFVREAMAPTLVEKQRRWGTMRLVSFGADKVGSPYIARPISLPFFTITNGKLSLTFGDKKTAQTAAKKRQNKG